MIPFSDEELYYAVKNALPQVSGYVNSHGGGITLLGVKDGVIYIQLIGTCHGCSMSLMTTNMVVRRELRRLIHPELFVVNVDGTAENKIPNGVFTQDDKISKEEKIGVFDKVKNIFHK